MGWGGGGGGGGACAARPPPSSPHTRHNASAKPLAPPSLQYGGMAELVNSYGKRGLEVLAFPCNQFGGQEPGSNSDVKKFAAGTGFKGVLLGKVNVNGPDAEPLFQYLKSEKKGLLTCVKEKRGAEGGRAGGGGGGGVGGSVGARPPYPRQLHPLSTH